MIDKKILMDILDSREARARKQKELINEYKSSLISFTLNIPGSIKDNDLYRDIHKSGMKAILNAIKDNNTPVAYKEVLYKNTGTEAFIVVDMDSLELKRLTIGVEEVHPLGRIFDIDVLDNQGDQVGRSAIGVGPRRCLLCHREVRTCMREKNHSYEDLIGAIEALGKKYL